MSMKFDLSLVQSKIFGCDVKNVLFAVIIPIPSIYDTLRIRLSDSYVENINGFYRSTFIVESGKNIGLLICLPQGVQSQDVLYALPDVPMLFFGFAGGLRNSLTIGSVVEVSEAMEGSDINHGLIETKLFQSVRCGYSPCLLGDLASEHCERALSMNCDIVDMEIVFLARAAKRNNNQLTAWALITDMPGNVNFWETEDYHQENLDSGLNLAIKHIVDFVNKNRCRKG